MSTEKSHKTVELTYKIRPKRVCFVVRDGDIEGLKRALEVDCFSWGGFFSTFIITKDATGLKPDDLKFIKIFDPDELVIVSSSDNPLISKYRKLGINVISIESVSNFFASPIGIPINAILYDSEKKNTQKTKKPKLIVPKYPSDAFELGYLLKYGIRMDDKEEDKLLNAFQLPRTEKLKSYFNIEEPEVDNKFRTYIDISLDRLASIEGEYVYDLPSLTKFRVQWNDSNHYYTDEEFHDNSEGGDDAKSEMIFVLSKKNDSFDDFALAWNLQSKRPFFNLPISPFPILIPPNTSDDDIKYAIKEAREVISRLHIPINSRIYITSKSFNLKELQSKAGNFDATPVSPAHLPILKKGFSTGEEIGGFGFSNGDYVRVNTPKFENLDIYTGSYSIDFAGENVTPPRNQNTRDYFPYGASHSKTSNYGITEIKSIGIRSAHSHKISLRTPTPYETLRGYVLPHNTTIKLSSSGKTGSLAKILLDEELFHELKIISNERIFNLLEKMKKIKGRSLFTRYWKQSTSPILDNVSKKLGKTTAAKVSKTLDEIRDSSLSRLERDINDDREHLTFEQIQSALQTDIKITSRIIEWFLEKHILERRASINCRVCGQGVLLRLDQIKDTILCPKCFKEFRFVNPQNEISWLYRETESWAELQTSDVLPSLLALLYLEFMESEVSFTSLVGGWTGVEFSFKDDDDTDFNAEIDITAFIYRELVLGESKLKSTDFVTDHGKEQIARMVKLAIRLDVNYLLFACLDTCSKTTQNKISQLTKRLGYKGKLLFYDKSRLFNQEVSHIYPSDNADTHMKQVVNSYLGYWEEKRLTSIY